MNAKNKILTEKQIERYLKRLFILPRKDLVALMAADIDYAKDMQLGTIMSTMIAEVAYDHIKAAAIQLNEGIMPPALKKISRRNSV